MTETQMPPHGGRWLRCQRRGRAGPQTPHSGVPWGHRCLRRAGGSRGRQAIQTTSYPDAQLLRQLLGVLRPSLPKTLRHAGAAELPGVHRLPPHATQTLGRRAVLGAPGRAPSRLRLLLPLVPSRLALLLPVPSAPLPPPSGGCAGGSTRPAASTHFAENGGDKAAAKQFRADVPSPERALTRTPE